MIDSEFLAPGPSRRITTKPRFLYGVKRCGRKSDESLEGRSLPGGSSCLADRFEHVPANLKFARGVRGDKFVIREARVIFSDMPICCELHDCQTCIPILRISLHLEPKCVMGPFSCVVDII